MPSIVKKRRLRTGTAAYGKSSNLVDYWQLQIDEQVDQATFLELWIDDGDLPIPQVTTKTAAGKDFNCDKINPSVINTERYFWMVRVDWIETADQDPQGSSPIGPGSDPLSWLPVVTRRPVTVMEPADRLYYEGGYTGAIDTEYDGNTSGGDKSPFTNSAYTPFRDQLPPHQRKQSLWTIRWVRPTIPTTLLPAELKVNNADIVFSHRGYTEDWAEKTAKIESVSVSEVKVGTVNMWELTVEILHDADGHFIEAIDQGFMEVIHPGEPLPDGSSALVRTPQIVTDANKKPLTEPVLLNGNGQRLTSGDAVVGKWRDFDTFDFTAIALVKDLVTNA